MPSTYSARLRLEDIGNGEQTGTWGDTTDRNITTLVEEAIAGVAQVSMTDANYTLTSLNGTSDEARQMVIELTGTLTAQRNVVCPTAEKLYFVYNNTTGGQNIVFKTSGGTGITIPSGKKRIVYCDGTNVVDAISDLPSSVTIAGGSLVTDSSATVFSNKTIGNTNTVTLKDTLFTLQDNSDATKQLQFELSGITTATTRTLTVPNANDTLAVLAAVQAITNKTLDNSNTVTVRDDRFTIQDNGDTTKQAVFQASGITTATTRTYTLPDATGTLLLSTGDGSSLTGIRKQGKETIWVPATAMYSPTTNGAAAGTTSGTNVILKTLDFDTNNLESAQFSITLPKSWNRSTITFQPYWVAASGSGTVTWSLSAVAVSDDDPYDASFGSAQTSADTLIATTDIHVGAESSAITVAGSPAVGDIVFFKIARTAGTLAVDAKLVGVKIYYTTNATSDD